MTTGKDDRVFLAGHRARLRARLEQDPTTVADYEILELVLGLSLARKDTKILAHALLDRFKTIRGVLDARPGELIQLPGFGEGLLSLWRLLREVLARYAASNIDQKECLSGPEAVLEMARARMGGMSAEESWLALVDAQNRLIFWNRLQKGSVSSVAVQPRDVLEVAILHRASGIILLHNHPGGSPLPSKSDRSFTRELADLAPRLGLRLLDHLIVTSGDCFSIVQNRLIKAE